MGCAPGAQCSRPHVALGAGYNDSKDAEDKITPRWASMKVIIMCLCTAAACWWVSDSINITSDQRETSGFSYLNPKFTFSKE